MNEPALKDIEEYLATHCTQHQNAAGVMYFMPKPESFISTTPPEPSPSTPRTPESA